MVSGESGIQGTDGVRPKAAKIPSDAGNGLAE